MPAYSTYPTLLDEVNQISITDLKEFGYFQPDSSKSGKLIWSRRGQEIGSINILVSLRESPYALLTYTYNKKESINYKVKLDSLDSNLGIGKIWYFVCPDTGKRCRKLYGAGKYFLHRDAYPDAMYESQTYSEYQRKMNKVFDAVFGADKYDEMLYKKHFKTHYKGKPTKKYLKVLEKMSMAKKMRGNLMDYFV
jgi:hypothetical protein